MEFQLESDPIAERNQQQHAMHDSEIDASSTAGATVNPPKTRKNTGKIRFELEDPTPDTRSSKTPFKPVNDFFDENSEEEVENDDNESDDDFIEDEEHETNAFNTFVVDPSEENSKDLKVRLDKWLWAARFFKTRALARAAVEAGKVSYNGYRAKPSREVQKGATLNIRQGRFDKVIMIKDLSTRRRSMQEASDLFEELHSPEQPPLQISNRDFWNAPAHTHSPYSNPNYHEKRAPQQQKSVRFLRRAFKRGPHQSPLDSNKDLYLFPDESNERGQR